MRVAARVSEQPHAPASDRRKGKRVALKMRAERVRRVSDRVSGGNGRVDPLPHKRIAVGDEHLHLRASAGKIAAVVEVHALREHERIKRAVLPKHMSDVFVVRQRIVQIGIVLLFGRPDAGLRLDPVPYAFRVAAARAVRRRDAA